MDRPNRDLLVMFKQELYTPQALEQEVCFLHELLYSVERSIGVLQAHEIINVNKFKISSNTSELKKAIRSSQQKPFVFLNNKN